LVNPHRQLISLDEFKLVEEKELAPLAELIQQFKARKETKENAE
jgi:MOB kinase activator 1